MGWIQRVAVRLDQTRYVEVFGNWQRRRESRLPLKARREPVSDCATETKPLTDPIRYKVLRQRIGYNRQKGKKKRVAQDFPQDFCAYNRYKPSELQSCRLRKDETNERQTPERGFCFLMFAARWSMFTESRLQREGLGRTSVDASTAIGTGIINHCFFVFDDNRIEGTRRNTFATTVALAQIYDYYHNSTP